MIARIKINNSKGGRSDQGFTVTEMLILVGVIGVLCSLALPQMISQRRLYRTSNVSREIMVQMRLARQMAMARREAFTFQYDHSSKEIKIIGPIPSGASALANASYPNNSGSSVIVSIPLTQGGLPASEFNEGIPTTSTGLPAGAPTIPTSALDDGVSRTTLSSNRLNITFQPDGSVIDSAGAPVNKALFFFNKKAAQTTATAISVLGSSGRIKIWRYTTNGNKYAE